MKRLVFVMLMVLFCLSWFSSTIGLTATASETFDLQAAIDTAQSGDVIQVPPGLYQGNFVINKPLTLEGIDRPILDANFHGTVIDIENVPDVTVRGFVIRNSGTRLDKEDAGLSAHKSPRLVVENNRLEGVLFGIKVKDSAGSRIINNEVGAKPELEVASRGDSILVWYSYYTEVIGNRVQGGRDVVFWYNNGAVIRDNVISDNRYGLHFMYCDDALVENNRVENNSVGAFLMYSRNLTVRHNIFAGSRGPSGYGIGLKDMDGVEATDNLLSGNRVGIYFDNSPWSKDVNQHFTQNAFMYNNIGLLFAPSVKRNYFSQNSFIENAEQVGLTSSGDFKENFFTVADEGNFWSDYAGYDTAGDGVGDLPYVSKSLFESMMTSNPHLRLFQLSPAQQAIDLAARAFPIFQPKPKFTDDAPLMVPPFPAITPPPPGPTWPLWGSSLALLSIAGCVLLMGYQTTNNRRSVATHPQTNTPHLSLENTSMIKVTNLTKRFGQFIAVDDLSFTVSAGEAIALWGPNGAGKTTIIRSLLGLLSAKGTLLINEYNAQTQGKKARAAVGYVPQELAFYNDLSAWDSLAFYAQLKNVAPHRVDAVLAEVGLTEHGHKVVAALSGGMKQRLALAAALLADPPILILDEPTSNLDTAARDDFINLLLAQKERGKTLLFTSHRLEEVEQLASRILVLEAGQLKLICNDSTELAHQLELTSTLKLSIPESFQEQALQLLHQQGFKASRNGVGLHVTVLPSTKLTPLKLLLAENIKITNFDIEDDPQHGS